MSNYFLYQGRQTREYSNRGCRPLDILLYMYRRLSLDNNAKQNVYHTIFLQIPFYTHVWDM